MDVPRDILLQHLGPLEPRVPEGRQRRVLLHDLLQRLVHQLRVHQELRFSRVHANCKNLKVRKGVPTQSLHTPHARTLKGSLYYMLAFYGLRLKGGVTWR